MRALVWSLAPALPLAMVSACAAKGDDSGGDGSGGDDTGAAPAAACLDDWTDGVVEVDPDGPDTQIHTTVVRDGSQLWFAWNRPNDARNFDIWAGALGCDGATAVAPFELSESDDNELDPVLAISGDRMLVAWMGSMDDGLQVRRVVLDTDGAPVGAVAALAASRAGVPVTGNATLPVVAPLDDGFLLAGSWGHDDAPAFQAFAVELDASGAARGDATDAELDPEHSQLYVDLAVVEGTPHLVWQEDAVDSTAPRAWASALGEDAVPLGDPGARPALVDGPGGLWHAWDDNRGAVFVQAPGGAAVELDLGSGTFHSPRLASTGDTVVALVMELDSGVYNRLRLVVLDEAGVVEDVPLAAEAAPSPYEADVVLVDETHAVVAWQEGENPAFRSYAEWVSWAP